ncbi:hypothetical protein COL516b_004049 [Colletotrichum fioriniae]|nr:uncharacterized protein COL516b_004049 [Colletotrichum fioriniae]KAJ0307435.1 hypothetical protein COL516b_004049 [Colletotrichum fioriniae]
MRLILENKGQGENEDGSEPEFRLPPAMFGSILVPAGIFMFGWSMYPWVHWMVPIVGTAMFGAGYGKFIRGKSKFADATSSL